MALEYRLTLAGRTPVGDVAGRALPDGRAHPAEWERPADAPPLWTADLFDECGFVLDVIAGANAYIDVLTDDGTWVWKPPAHVAVGFRMDKFTDPHRTVQNMLTVVGRVLDTGPEDAAFVFNGDALLLRRDSGRITKHRQATWWRHYTGAG